MELFGKILGQEYAKRYLKNSIRANKLSNAYIFDGIDGIGKKTMAVSLAEYLTGTQLEFSNDINLVELDKKETAHKIDTIRDINTNISLQPLSNYKFIIINDAHKMTVQAQNAFLKTLEEPPSFAVIILVTSNRDALLDTIKSRCEIIKFRPVGEADIVKYLEGKDISDETARSVARFSKGSISIAENLCSSDDFMKMRKEVSSLADILVTGDIQEKIDTVSAIENRKGMIDEFFDMLMELYIDCYIFKHGINRNLIVNSDKINLIKKINRNLNYSDISAIIDVVQETKMKIKGNCIFNLAVSNMIFSVDSIVKKSV